MASTKYVDFLVTGDPGMARATAEQALLARKFKITWTSEWSGFAERGSKIGNALAGAAAQYFKVGLHLTSSGPGVTTVRIERSSSGWAGGAIGASRTTKNFDKLRSELEGTFAGAGVLNGVVQG